MLQAMVKLAPVETSDDHYPTEGPSPWIGVGILLICVFFIGGFGLLADFIANHVHIE